MSRMRRTATALTVTAVAASALSGLAPAEAGAVGPIAPRAANCHVQHHLPKYRTATAYDDIKPEPVITQIGARTVPPGGGRTVKFEVANVDNFTAGATVGGSYSAKVGNKLIGEAKVELHAELSASGSTTKTTRTTVTEYVKNRTKRNQKYVGFRGTIKIGAGVLQSYCDSSSQSTPYGTERWRRVGSWKTFTFIDEGTAQCGGGATGLVPRRALAIGCR